MELYLVGLPGAEGTLDLELGSFVWSAVVRQRCWPGERGRASAPPRSGGSRRSEGALYHLHELAELERESVEELANLRLEVLVL